ncbi:MAG: transglycosylase domain-containing protein, partial [Owenweeksia sp.]
MKRKYIRKALFWTGGLIAAFILGILLFFLLVRWEVFGPLPSKEELKDIHNATATLVFSSDRHLIGKVFEENRTNVSYEEFPQNLVHALIATEDARFFEHEGIDNRSVLRVLFKSILLGDRSSGGGSTITQQLAKNLYGRRNFGFLTMPVNKVKEMVLADRIEEIYTKEEILQLYLNTVSFSENVYGIGEGSRRFFGKPVKELHAEESAVLVGILKANTYYNPRLNPDHALGRRNVVLNQMYRYEYLTREEADSLKQLPLK